MADKRQPTRHRMDRRSHDNDYAMPGMYHVTLHVADGLGQPLGRVVGDARQPDGSPDEPRVALTAIGRMVEHELTHTISSYYPMVEIQDHVVMPEHLHVIIEVHAPIVSRQGRQAHLGQVIAGFKKGCNRAYWALTGQSAAAPSAEDGIRRGKPAGTEPITEGSTDGRDGSCPVVFPQGHTQSGSTPPAPTPLAYKVPSRAATERAPLFAPGYVDVMPLRSGQLQQQRRYIHDNPRSRLLRMTHRALLQPLRGGIDTALSLRALYGYLSRECMPQQLTAAGWSLLSSRLLTTDGIVACDSYGDRRLLTRCLLPVVCHRRDRWRLARQKAQCLMAARQGAVLASARIAAGEQDIIDEALAQGYPVLLVIDNGMPERYHPSAVRMAQCLHSQLLLVTPWHYHYRSEQTAISVAECKTMNAVVQALCRQRDDWWMQSSGTQSGDG